MTELHQFPDCKSQVSTLDSFTVQTNLTNPSFCIRISWISYMNHWHTDHTTTMTELYQFHDCKSQVSTLDSFTVQTNQSFCIWISWISYMNHWHTDQTTTMTELHQFPDCKSQVSTLDSFTVQTNLTNPSFCIRISWISYMNHWHTEHTTTMTELYQFPDCKSQVSTLDSFTVQTNQSFCIWISWISYMNHWHTQRPDNHHDRYNQYGSYTNSLTANHTSQLPVHSHDPFNTFCLIMEYTLFTFKLQISVNIWQGICRLQSAGCVHVLCDYGCQ